MIFICLTILFKSIMKNNVLFLTTNLPGGSAVADVKKYRDSIIHVLDYCDKGNYHLTIKLHPSENTDYYKTLLKEQKKSVIIIQNCDLYEIIRSNDIIIGFPTTALLEAKKLGKICYYINPWKGKLPYPFDFNSQDQYKFNMFDELKDNKYFSNINDNIFVVISTILNNTL